MDYLKASEEIMANHGFKEVVIDGRKNFVTENKNHYLRIDCLKHCLMITNADSYEMACAGVYDDCDGFDYTNEADFFNILQMYIVLFYKSGCLSEKLFSLGFRRCLNPHRAIFEKQGILCEVFYEFGISKTVCIITAQGNRIYKEFDYDEGDIIVTSILEEIQKVYL